MPLISVVGLDTSKNVFQVHGVDSNGKVTLRKRLRRAQVSEFFANLPACVIGLEATQGAHHWARVLETFGHTVRLVAPQFVKPYLQSQKNDANDAAAICEAVSRPHMHFVPRKTVEQQDLQALHRVRRPADRMPDTDWEPGPWFAHRIRDCVASAPEPRKEGSATADGRKRDTVERIRQTLIHNSL